MAILTIQGSITNRTTCNWKRYGEASFLGAPISIINMCPTDEDQENQSTFLKYNIFS